MLENMFFAHFLLNNFNTPPFSSSFFNLCNFLTFFLSFLKLFITHYSTFLFPTAVGSPYFLLLVNWLSKTLNFNSSSLLPPGGVVFKLFFIQCFCFGHTLLVCTQCWWFQYVHLKLFFTYTRIDTSEQNRHIRSGADWPYVH